MGLRIIEGKDIETHAALMDDAFRLRHKAFVDDLKWERLRKPDGREVDQFDHAFARHFIIEKAGKAAVYTRLLPTEHPHLLSDVYPHLAPRGVPRGPDIWEWTRLVVAHPLRGDGRWSLGAGEMVRIVVEHCLNNGITALTWEGHPVWMTRFLELGFWPEPLGLPELIDGEPVLAGVMPVTQDILDGLIARDIPTVPLAVGVG